MPSLSDLTKEPGAMTQRNSLTTRILLVNIIAVALLAGSILYLDFYRNQQIEGRYDLALSEAQITAEALAGANAERIQALLVQIGKEQDLRLRLYNEQGELAFDSFELDEPSFSFRPADAETFSERLGRGVDSTLDVLFRRREIAAYVEPEIDEAAAWPEIVAATKDGLSQVFLRTAPDRSPVITTAAPVGTEGAMLLTMRNDLELAEDVREGRTALAAAVFGAFAVSIFLSLFLARTIVQPLRDLVQAAIRVRLGRDREVEVPRLPDRGDEIGLLARAVSDMTHALRQRIDSVESFAADVAHELKNPLASLRSALETLKDIDDPEQRKQLTDIAQHDVQRIDRLVSEIADASRVDAELSRAVFDPIDLSELLRGLLQARENRSENGSCNVILRQAGDRPTSVKGVPIRLEMVLDNLLDNAISFSPEGGEIDVLLQNIDDQVSVAICDQGPGIPASERQSIFNRFHSVRPEGEDFGRHSGLGLAIARSIAEAHDGSLSAHDRPDGEPGACFILELPALEN